MSALLPQDGSYIQLKIPHDFLLLLWTPPELHSGLPHLHGLIMRHCLKVISIFPVGPTDNHISDKGLGPQLQWCSQDNRRCADTVTDLHPAECRKQLRTDSGARSLEMGGKARDGLTELYVENNETDDIEKEPSLGCVLVLVKK